MDREARTSVRAHQGERARARSLDRDGQAHRRRNREQDAIGEGRDEGGKGALARALWYAELRKSLGSFKKYPAFASVNSEPRYLSARFFVSPQRKSIDLPYSRS